MNREKVLEAWKNGISFNEAMELMEKLTREDCEKEITKRDNVIKQLEEDLGEVNDIWEEHEEEMLKEQRSRILEKVKALPVIERYNKGTHPYIETYISKMDVIKIIREEK